MEALKTDLNFFVEAFRTLNGGRGEECSGQASFVALNVSARRGRQGVTFGVVVLSKTQIEIGL